MTWIVSLGLSGQAEGMMAGGREWLGGVQTLDEAHASDPDQMRLAAHRINVLTLVRLRTHGSRGLAADWGWGLTATLLHPAISVLPSCVWAVRSLVQS